MLHTSCFFALRTSHGRRAEIRRGPDSEQNGGKQAGQEEAAFTSEKKKKNFLSVRQDRGRKPASEYEADHEAATLADDLPHQF